MISLNRVSASRRLPGNTRGRSLSALPSRFPPSRRVFKQRLENWLLSAVQFERGRDCGAVIGSISNNDGPEYLYPEAAGYFLTWLAFIGLSRPDASIRAFRAVSWLSQQAGSTDALLTRFPLNGRAPDWRNRGFFSFDLAMMCRGVAAVRDCVPRDLAQECLDRLLRLYARFCPGDGTLTAVLPRDSTALGGLPSRWSTRPGPYQLKPAAAILAIPRDIAGAPLHDEMKTVYFSWRNHCQEEPRRVALHPLLYHVEGLLLGFDCGIDPGGLAVARSLYPSILRRVERHCPRSDVLAQALRAGCLLLGETGDIGAMARLCGKLSSFLDANGALLFRRALDGGVRHWNTWSAIFGHQGLTFFDRVDRGTSPERAGMELLA